MDPEDRDQNVCATDTVQRSISETETSRIKGILADRMPAPPGNDAKFWLTLPSSGLLVTILAFSQ
jgi:hypothetical protein